MGNSFVWGAFFGSRYILIINNVFLVIIFFHNIAPIFSSSATFALTVVLDIGGNSCVWRVFIKPLNFSANINLIF